VAAVILQSEFVVEAPLDQVWAHLLDVEKIAPCAPGAELTEIVDERTWKGKVNVKVGPVAMSFAGTVTLQERDDAAHRAVLRADGREQRGKGAATAVVTSRLEDAEGGTRVVIETDLTISGAAAQYGRGMIGDVSKRLTNEFAACLEANLTAPSPTPVASAGSLPKGEGDVSVAPEPAVVPSPQAKPVKGIRLALWALWRAISRFFSRLLGRRSG
jgi:carbon monoxide dehydrogenase subunit G